MKSNIQQLKGRGYIENVEIEEFAKLSKEQLINMLESKIPSERTISIKLLEKYKDKEVLKLLIRRLTVENKLYTKIELSEVISSYGEDASDILIDYLGKIGSNQYKEMPNKPFGKNNYPLPRDIVARTMCKIGKLALKSLKHCLKNGDYIQKLEAIDAIGFISYYENDRTLMNDIIELMSIYDFAKSFSLVCITDSVGSFSILNNNFT
jgi:HEAT repeat protein